MRNDKATNGVWGIVAVLIGICYVLTLTLGCTTTDSEPEPEPPELSINVGTIEEIWVGLPADQQGLVCEFLWLAPTEGVILDEDGLSPEDIDTYQDRLDLVAHLFDRFTPTPLGERKDFIDAQCEDYAAAAEELVEEADLPPQVAYVPTPCLPPDGCEDPVAVSEEAAVLELAETP